MYGTVARIRVKPENRAEFIRVLEDDTPGPETGFVRSELVFEEEGDGAWLIAVFADRERYYANADDPRQAAGYARFRPLLEADPEWHDGEVVGYPRT